MLALAWPLCACAWAGAAGAAPGGLAGARAAMMPSSAPPSAAAIVQVTLEGDCHGCASGLRLELPRGGPAVAHRLGKARHRTADTQARAALSPGEFEALVQAVLAAGFFSMADRYEDASLADGAWVAVTVRHAGGEHRVFRREDAGPPALQALLAQIEALQARLLFVPDAR